MSARRAAKADHNTERCSQMYYLFNSKVLFCHATLTKSCLHLLPKLENLYEKVPVTKYFISFVVFFLLLPLFLLSVPLSSCQGKNQGGEKCIPGWPVAMGTMLPPSQSLSGCCGVAHDELGLFGTGEVIGISMETTGALLRLLCGVFKALEHPRGGICPLNPRQVCIQGHRRCQWTTDQTPARSPPRAGQECKGEAR